MNRFPTIVPLLMTGLMLAVALSATAAEPPGPATKPTLALPTKAQLEWADLEFGMFVHGPSASHAEDLAECAARMGARYVLIVAKHNNGYIHWHSKTDVRIGVQKDGKPDNVGAVVAEARKRNLKIGFYCVPADWGDGVGDGGLCADPVKQEAWRKKYIEEVRELCSNYGPVVEFWFDGGIKADFLDRVNVVLKELQPNVCSFNGSYNPIRWVGNEEGHIGLPHWYGKANNEYWRYNGWPQDPRGPNFAFVECDTPAMGGNAWFAPGIGRSVDDLIDMYYRTVGRGAQFVLNVSPPVGASMKKATEFGEAIRNAVGHPLATTSGVGDEVVLDLGQTTEIDHVIVREDLSLGQRILKHRIDGFVAGAWKELAAGENLGTKRIYKIKPIVVTKVRVVVTERLDVPQIRSLYVTRTGIKAMDKHPPAPPTGLTGALVDGHTVKLSWTQPATSPDSGIARYAVYRGETRIGESTATEYSDRGLPEQTAYRYTVSVISGGGLESVRTAECAVTTPKDTEPPVLLGMKQVNATQLVAQFSEPIEEASATRAGNYRLDQGATVTAAVRGSDLSTVILTTSPLKELATYSLTVEGVRDLAKAPMSVAPGSKVSLLCANDLLLYCPLTEGTGDAVQERVGGKQQKIAGTAAWRQDQPQALVFDGTTTAVDLGLAPAYDTFTLAVWVRPDSDDAEKRKTGGGRWETLFSRDRAGADDYQFRLGLNKWGSPVFVMTPEAERQAIGHVSLLKPVTLPADAWTHLVVTRDAAGVFTLYVDGDSPPPQHAAQQHVQQQKNPEMGHPYNPVANLVLGAQMHKNLKDLVPSFKGALRDVRLYGRALSPDEIKDLVNRTKAP